MLKRERFALKEFQRSDTSVTIFILPVKSPLKPLLLGLLCWLTTISPSNAATWTNWNNGQSIGSFFGVAGTATETVAVGIDGRISTRNNSTGTWTIQTFTGDPDFRDVIYANGQYVTVREGGAIMTSPDGITWTTRTSPTTNDLRALLWDGHQYVAAGQNGTVITSSDAITWTLRNTGSTIFFNSLSYSGSVYVAAGGYGIVISSDAIIWKNTLNAPTSISFESSTWTGTQFVVGGLGFGSTPTLYTSPDGNTWTLRNSTIKDNVESMITVSGTTYITGSVNGTGNGFVRTSTDGATWTDIYLAPNGSEYFEDIAYNGQAIIAAGFNNNVWTTAATSQSSGLGLTISGSPSGVTLQWSSATGVSYQVQASPDLSTWSNVGSSITGDGTTKTASDSVGTTQRKFYRLVSSPVVTKLSIVSALYGASNVYKDVTSIIQGNIVNNTVNMPINNQTMGGDPAFGHVKQLTVTYTYNGNSLSKLVSENGTLVLP